MHLLLSSLVLVGLVVTQVILKNSPARDRPFPMPVLGKRQPPPPRY